MKTFCSTLQSSRRWMLGATSLSGAFLLMAGVAVACVVAQGTMTLANGGNEVSVTGDPGDGTLFMQWCQDQEVSPLPALAGDEVKLSITSAGTGSSNCAEDISGENKLPAGEYVVTFTNAAFDDSDNDNTYSDDELFVDCMAMPPTGGPIPMERTDNIGATFTVDSNGEIASGNPATYRIPQGAQPTDGSGQISDDIAAGVCVTKVDQEGYTYAPFVGGSQIGPVDGPPIGNFLPVEIVDLDRADGTG